MKRILIVDNDETARAALRSLDASLQGAARYEEGIEILAELLKHVAVSKLP